MNKYRAICIGAIFTCFTLPRLGFAEAIERKWGVAVGTSVASISPASQDFGTNPEFTTSGLTIPHIYLSRKFNDVALEAGYRKLGALKFISNAQTVSGHTHSNMLYVGGRWETGLTGPSNPLTLSVGASLIRTVTSFDRTSASFPIRGYQNIWQFSPVLGVGFDLPVTQDWVIRTRYDLIPFQLGKAGVSGRYRQQLLGIELIKHW